MKTTEPELKKYYRAKEASKELGICLSNFWKQIKIHNVPSRKIGNATLFRWEDIEKIIKSA